MPSTINIVKNAQNVYRTPLIEVSTKCVFTNTSHVSAYRGAGRPEGNYYMERMIDAAAAEMGIDRLELRRRNQIRPRELPIKTASGSNYDSGDFPSVLKHALEVADVKGFARRKRESRKRGKVRGLGDGRHPFRSRRHHHHHHRHAGLWPGSRRAVRAGAEREARRSVRAHPPPAGRQP
jgi:carbon-monoxide dehydrogenase large subunit